MEEAMSTDYIYEDFDRDHIRSVADQFLQIDKMLYVVGASAFSRDFAEQKMSIEDPISQLEFLQNDQFEQNSSLYNLYYTNQ